MKPRSWAWVPLDAVLAIHDEQISEHGGIRGVRDLAVIDSALARPHNVVRYGKPDAAVLAAAYVFGLCNNHGFLDGNKRTAYVVAETFLDLKVMTRANHPNRQLLVDYDPPKPSAWKTDVQHLGQ